MELHPDQERACATFVKMQGGIAWWLPGEGKTRIAINTFALLQKQYEWAYPSVCVVVCRRGAFFDWAEEFLKVGFIRWYVEEFNPEFPRYSEIAPTIWLVSASMLSKVWKHMAQTGICNMVIYDELYLYGNPKAARTRAAAKFTRTLRQRALGLSGTIMPARDNTTIWGQSLAVGLSRTLARNLTDFRSQYQLHFNPLGARQFHETKNAPGSKEKILKKLAPFVDIHFPKQRDRVIKEKISRVPATPEQKKLIKQLKEEYYAELSDRNELDIKTAIELTIKIQQIANGWLESSSGKFISVPSNKVTALAQSVDELVAMGEQCVIWCAFVHDLDVLANSLPFTILQMSGDRPFDIEAWKTGAANVVVATEGSGSSVNHFRNVAYAKYFSMSFKWFELQQSMGRTDRRDSEHSTCHYEFFQVKGSLDAHTFKTAQRSGAMETDFIKTGELIKWLTKKTD